MDLRFIKARSSVQHWTALETYLQAKIEIENRHNPRREIRLGKLAGKLRYIQGMKALAIRRLQDLEVEIESEDEV